MDPQIKQALLNLVACTGAGWTSLKGFWIPEKTDEAIAAALASLEGRGGGGRGGGRGRGRGRGRGGGYSGGGLGLAPYSGGRGGGGGRGSSGPAATRRTDYPPEPATHLPLPEGVPESVPVVCGSCVG